MMKDKEIDILFKNKLSERELAFNPANWEAMEQMLDDQKKGGAFFLWSSILIFIFGALVFGAIVTQGSLANTTSSQEHIQPDITTKSRQQQEASLSEKTLNTDSPTKEVLDEIPSSYTKNIQNNTAVKAAAESTTVKKIENNNITTDYHPITKDKVIEQTTSLEENREQLNPLYLNPKNALFISVLKPQLSEMMYYQEASSTITPKALNKYKKTHELWLQAGMDFSKSYSNDEVKTAYMAGLNYRYRVGKNIHLNIGLNYTAKLSPGIELSSDSTFYGFGRETIRTKIENERFDFIEMPFMAVYDINAKHQLGGGAYVAALVNVKRKVTHTHYYFKGEPTTQVVEETGLSKNYKSVDAGIMASYYFQYMPNTAIGVEFKYGLIDISNNVLPELAPSHKNMNVRLVLRYRLF